MLAKFVTELPLDASFAAGFGALLHWRIGLNCPSGVLVATLALTAACTAGLGLAIGALAPSPDSALAIGIGAMVVHMVYCEPPRERETPGASSLARGAEPRPPISPNISPNISRRGASISPTPISPLQVLGIINPAGASAKPPSLPVRWLSHLSPIKWSIRALCCAELRELELESGSLSDAPRMGALALVTSGEQVLERLGLHDESVSRACGCLGALLAAQLAVALVGLHWRRPRFQLMEPPEGAGPREGPP